MITAINYYKIDQAIEEAEDIVSDEMPRADFAFVGVDETHIYFNVACQLSKTSEKQIKDIKEKTRFEVVEENTALVYCASFKMGYTSKS